MMHNLRREGRALANGSADIAWSGARSRIAAHQHRIQSEPKARRPAAFKQTAKLASAFVREGLIEELEAREILEEISEQTGLLEDVGDAPVAIMINTAMRRADRLFDEETRQEAAIARKADAIEKRLGLGREERAKSIDRIIAADQLRTMTFPPVRFVLPGFVPEGLTILASKPKVGKSWLALDLCIAVAAGRFTLASLKPSEGDVLYLALEDSQRRLQRRIDKLLSPFSTDWPSRLGVVTEWPRLNDGGLAELALWCDRHPDARLLVIDTLEKIRPLDNGKGPPLSARLSGAHRTP